MVKKQSVCIALGILLFACAGTLHAKERAKEQTLSGTITLQKDKKNKVTGIDFNTNDGVTYKITMDIWGRKLGKAEDGGNYDITGTPSTKGKTKWLKVKSFKKAKLREGDPGKPPTERNPPKQLPPGEDPGGPEE